MEAFIVSFLVIAPAEMADKTQLVALFLASRFRKPAPIILGMLAAILVSHIAAGFIGQWIGSVLSENRLHILLGLSFLAAAIWAFIPDKMEENPDHTHDHKGIFLTTFITFIIAELGDKTQLATVALAAQFRPLISVIMGTTLGMMAVNTPVVILSHAITGRVSIKWVRALSGVVFAVLGIYELSKIGG